MKIKKAIQAALALGLTHSAVAGVISDDQLNNIWYTDAQTSISEKQAQKTIKNAKNIIVFIGDGMGISTLTAARILDGQNKENSGEEGLLSFEKFPRTALVKTYNVDAQTPDSAGTMTAMMSGLKTDMGVLGVAEGVVRGECESMENNEVTTALELAEIKGLSTGIVTTARITHATPAATYAKSPERNWEDISDMPDDAIEYGCKDIAAQLVNFESNLESRYNVEIDGIEVVMGGGRRHFLPNDASANSADASSAIEGDRTDGENLIEEWQSIYSEGVYVMDQSGFDAIDTETTKHLLGLFNESHMHYEADRHNDISGEPSLTEMTETAIKILDNNDNGYFLVVEAGRIDHAHHAGNAYNALMDTIELSNAVQAALDLTNDEETLIIVTADHGHVFTIAGYPKRGNPILGKVIAVDETQASLAEDGMPYTTLGYSNGRGFSDLGNETDADLGYDEAISVGRNDLSGVDTETSGFHQEATVPMTAETHSGEDITIHANGPGSYLVQGVMEQSALFHIIDKTLNLTAE
ncbi:MAG: alkaline phosphatase [Psychromonas sp.]